jgi:hypothetical protein
MSMPAHHSPEGAQLAALQQLLQWANLPEEPDSEEMHQFLADAKDAIDALSTKLKTGNLTRTDDEQEVDTVE